MKTIAYVLIFLTFSCNKASTEIEKNFTGIKYYGRCSRYNHPVRLIGELTLMDTKKQRAYFIGYYRRGILMRADKILDKKFEYSYIYEYDVSGNLIMLKTKRDNVEEIFPIN